MGDAFLFLNNILKKNSTYSEQKPIQLERVVSLIRTFELKIRANTGCLGFRICQSEATCKRLDCFFGDRSFYSSQSLNAREKRYRIFGAIHGIFIF